MSPMGDQPELRFARGAENPEHQSAQRAERLLGLCGGDSKVEGLPINWDGKDWRTYKWRMLSVFEEHGLQYILDATITENDFGSREGKERFRMQQAKIKRMIGQTLPPERLHQVSHLKTGTEMWNALCEVFEKKNNAGTRALVKGRLLEELASLKYKEGSDISVHLSRMFMIKNELLDYGHEVQDLDMINLMFSSLPPSQAYSQLRLVVRVTPDLTPEGVSALICEEVLSEESRVHSRQDRHDKRQGYKKGKRSGDDRGGNGKKNPMKNGKAEALKNGGDDIMASEGDRGDIRFGSMGDIWYFDSGSNVHVANEKSYFVHLDENPETLSRIRVYGAFAGLSAQAQGVGTACLKTVVDGRDVQVFLDDVVYIPTAEHGLLSPGRAIEQGFEVAFDAESSVYSLAKDGETVVRAPMVNATWQFQAMSAPKAQPSSTAQMIVNYTAADGVATLQQWHERCGHICMQYLKAMVDRGLVF
ncbi:hypothetical protein P43SY_008831 [Pythium insidiosum]|uniref:Retrovirus-related Pol polyprotein from transposon TNT 1-94-like beta-barrel domain-containing protein n=1 Tax=Pythium insidiosum TaxID=114742 RepID=A0AAD5LSK0_PYTIN|nr:hypothetical protein P43SY_008831 [Pythium insidiosum]